MLHFNGLEPVDFKGHLCEPKIDAEKKLRLQNANYDTVEHSREADDILASCLFLVLLADEKILPSHLLGKN